MSANPPSPSADRARAEEIIAQVQEIGAQAKAFRERHPDSPLNAVAFRLAAMCGEIEAAVNSKRGTDQ